MKYISLPPPTQKCQENQHFFMIISILMELRFQKANGSVNEIHTGSIAKSIIWN